MRSGCYYLNNDGSRWVVLDNGRREQREWNTKSGNKITRRVIYYFSFGNFGGACISYKGRRINVLADSVLDD